MRGLSPPLGIRAHFSRGWPPPKLCLEGVPLEDICMAAGWSFAHTFVRFYNLDVNKTPGSQVLSVWASSVLVFWSVMGQIWQCVSLVCVVYRSHCVKLRSFEWTYERKVYVNHIGCRGGISHHQPMNWRDSIRASDNHHTWGCSPLRKAT